MWEKMLREGAAFRIRRSELGAGTRKWVLGARHQLHPALASAGART